MEDGRPREAAGDQAASSISPSRRRATRKRRWSRRSRSTASAGRRPTRASSRRCVQEYFELDNRRFIPTDVGKIVNRFLTGNFERYVDYGFTAAMEDELDDISRGEEDWVPALERFWKPFKKQVEDIEENVTRADVAQARDLGIDPASGRPVSVRMGRYGAFVQIGTKDDEEKPKFAGLRPARRWTTSRSPTRSSCSSCRASSATGRTATRSRSAIGRFGPYVQYGAKKYVSLKKEDDPYTITLERALELIREEGRDRGEPHHPGLPGGRHPGAERPLRPVHHRRQRRTARFRRTATRSRSRSRSARR